MLFMGSWARIRTMLSGPKSRWIGKGLAMTDDSAGGPAPRSQLDEVVLSPEDAAEAARLLQILLRMERPAADESDVLELENPSKVVRYERQEVVEAARKIFLARRARARFLDSELLGEPGWDILLALYVRDGPRIGETTNRLTELSGAPMTTGLRWIHRLAKLGLVQRTPSPNDKRLVFVRLTDEACGALNRYFAKLLEKGWAK